MSYAPITRVMEARPMIPGHRHGAWCVLSETGETVADYLDAKFALRVARLGAMEEALRLATVALSHATRFHASTCTCIECQALDRIRLATAEEDRIEANVPR